MSPGALPTPTRATCVAWLVLALVGVAPSRTYAVDCNSLPNPVYGLGGSAQEPLIGRVARVLAGLPAPQTVIYAAPGACNGIRPLLADPSTAGARMSGTASYWTSAGMKLTCDLPIAGVPVEFASMGNSATGCTGITALPASVGDFTGPVSTVNILVPNASSQQSISAEALYFVYGFGASGNAAPWTDEATIIRRDANSYVQLFVSLASGVPVTRFVGVDAGSNGNTITLLRSAANPERAIGFASGEVADGARANVRTLAYQHTGQSCGYWPDSTASAFDKRNVRDGHYFLWSYGHFFARIDETSRVITSPGARNLIGYITGTLSIPELNILDVSIANNNVPACAMRVTRSGDLAPLASYAPPEPCGCYFEARATGHTDCAACSAEAPCASGVCRHGYCEAY